MSESSSINTLIGTFSSIGSITERAINPSNLICIDTSSNRIGINTIDPSYSITIVDNNSDNSSNGIYTPRLYFDLSKLPIGLTSTSMRGEVYYDLSGFLKVRL